MSPRVCLISTVRHNVGDDFVREGILWLLKKILGPMEIRVVHKHFPVTARGSWALRLDAATRGIQQRLPLRIALSQLADSLPLQPASDAVLASDFVVQCGAPVYWKNRYSTCAVTEWYGPLLERRWQRVRERVPLLNLGAGSCQALASDGGEVWQDQACRDFIQKFTAAASVTTVRDRLAQQIVQHCAGKVPLLPCPSVFAPQAANLAVPAGRYAALNYMRAGGHFDLAAGNGGIGQAWEKRFVETARAFATRHACLLICHDAAEEQEARRLLPEIPRRLIQSSRDALLAYAECRFAVVNRIHGGVVAAAMSKPVVVIGNDTRLLTAQLMPGVRALPVTADQAEFDQCVRDLESTPPVAHTSAFLEQAERGYLEILQPVLSR